jgi:hypothetical protein
MTIRNVIAPLQSLGPLPSQAQQELKRYLSANLLSKLTRNGHVGLLQPHILWHV